jgi:peptidoglycan/xylan/chitin deacetylase (PgdA/CDA1 family)
MLRKVLNKLLRSSGITLICYLFCQKRKITILYYHSIDSGNFLRQVNHLQRRYNIISIHDLHRYLYDVSASLPPWPLLITFDDGHSSNAELLPVIREKKIRPVIFLSSGYIGTERKFWFNFSFYKKDEKKYLKSIPNNERIEYLNKNYQHELVAKEKQSLSWEEVREMLPHVDFQSHTMEHPILTQCSRDEVHAELLSSGKMIEEETGKEVFAIAYPNGDHSEREIDIAREKGYSMGFTTIPGLNTKNTNPFKLKRFSMNDTSDFDDFILRTTGVWFLIKRILK